MGNHISQTSYSFAFWTCECIEIYSHGSREYYCLDTLTKLL